MEVEETRTSMQSTMDSPVNRAEESARHRWTMAGFRRGLVAAIPVTVGVVAYGIVFGVLARQVGLTLLEVILMNTLVFAGAAQTAALDLWTYPLPILAIVTTTLLINLRNLLLGASLRPWLDRYPAGRVYPWLHILADEGWAVAMNRYGRGERDAGFLFGALLMVTAGWIPSTVVGYLLGSQIGDPAAIGLDFAFAAIFAAMLFGSWRGRYDLVPWVTSGVVAWLTYRWLPGTWYIMTGALAGCCMVALTVDSSKFATVTTRESRE
jgi:4-azaleucine resistance transporter AzlC